MADIVDGTVVLTREEKTTIALQMARNYIERMPKVDSDGADCTLEALQVIAAIEDLDFDTSTVKFQVEKDLPYVDFREAAPIDTGPVLFGYKTNMAGEIFPFKYTGRSGDISRAVAGHVIWTGVLPEADWNRSLDELTLDYPVELNGKKRAA